MFPFPFFAKGVEKKETIWYNGIVYATCTLKQTKEMQINMKTKTKQMISVVLLLGMTMMMLSLSAFAAGTTTFTLGHTQGKPGDTVNVSVTISSTAIINSIGLRDLTYDTDALTFLGFANYEAIEQKCFLSAFDEDKVTVVLALTESQALDSYVCNLQFKIKAGAANGVKEIGMTSIIKNDSETISSSVMAGSITIEGGKADTDAPTTETDAPSAETNAPAPETNPPSTGTPNAGTPSTGTPNTPWNNPFTDVAENASYYNAIRFVYENNLFKGMSATEFKPDYTMNRAMFVTVLGRLENVDTRYFFNTCSFDDIDTVNGTWYHPYVEWASAKEIVQGYGNGKFGVEDNITVEQAVVILARYAKHADVYKEATLSITSYADHAKVSDWALSEMKWAVKNGIYTGEDGKLNPQAPASRALVATMMYRYVNAFSK